MKRIFLLTSILIFVLTINLKTNGNNSNDAKKINQKITKEEKQKRKEVKHEQKKREKEEEERRKHIYDGYIKHERELSKQRPKLKLIN